MSKIVHVYIFLGGTSHTVSVPAIISSLYFTFFPLSFSSTSFSVPSPTPLHFSNSLHASVFPFRIKQPILLLFFFFHFLQALINPAWTLAPTSCTVDFGNVHLELFQLPGGLVHPEIPWRTWTGKSGFPQEEASLLCLSAPCFLGPVPTQQFVNAEGKACVILRKHSFLICGCCFYFSNRL